jgi:putative ABC transport system ATP-binding protein
VAVKAAAVSAAAVVVAAKVAAAEATTNDQPHRWLGGAAMSLIELENVTKAYRVGTQDVFALNGVSVNFEQGEVTAIMGHSGSGKSTMMNLLGCLDVPTSGTYRLEGNDVGSWTDDQLAETRNKKIGFVFQTYNLLPRLTALANVELALLYGRNKNTRARSLDALDAVGLKPRADHKPAQLSGGEQQRVGIARALVKEPVLLLADEPTGNLDNHTSNEIMATLQGLNRDRGVTVVIVTHENDIAQHAHRVVSFSDGRVVGDARMPHPLVAVSTGAQAEGDQR